MPPVDFNANANVMQMQIQMLIAFITCTRALPALTHTYVLRYSRNNNLQQVVRLMDMFGIA